jgi:hypothetical protein
MKARNVDASFAKRGVNGNSLKLFFLKRRMAKI